MIHVVIADDHPVVRQGLKRILAEETDMTLTAEAGTGQELMEKLGEAVCDVVLLDISMPGRGGLDTLNELRRQHPKLPISPSVLATFLPPGPSSIPFRCSKGAARSGAAESPDCAEAEPCSRR